MFRAVCVGTCVVLGGSRRPRDISPQRSTEQIECYQVAGNHTVRLKVSESPTLAHARRGATAAHLRSRNEILVAGGVHGEQVCCVERIARTSTAIEQGAWA